MALAIAILACLIWAYLLIARGGFWRAAVDAPAPPPARWPDVAAIVPARNEEAVIGEAVGSLLRQDYAGAFRVIVVDDHSTDATAARARAAAEAAGAAARLEVVPAASLPPGWAGKVWAMQQGWECASALAPDADYVLFTDADIRHEPGNLAGLVARAERDGLDLASLMVLLRCRSLAERATVPAFVFFFAMLYPFRWVADPARRVAAAAGGCMLARRAAMARIGGPAAIRGALIDDCALAAALKAHGPIHLGLTRAARSLRGYPRFADVWRMVARSAYTELRYRPARLAGTVVGMAIVFLAPPILALGAGGSAALLGLLAWMLMTAAFWPMVRFYGVSPLWAPALPAIAAFYLGATIDSARRHWQGRGGEWKGRVQSAKRA